MDKEIFETLPSTDKEEIISFCQTNQLFLIFYQDIFQEKDELEATLFPILNRARHEGNYGAASDVLRVLLLRRFGGLYFDTDCTVASTFLPNQFSSTYINIHTMNRGVVCNDILAIPLAKEAMEDLELVCHSMLKAVQEKFKDASTGWTTHYAISYEKNRFGLPLHFTRRADTIRSTGPSCYKALTTTKEIRDQSEFGGKNVFFAHFANTWIRGRKVHHKWAYTRVDYRGNYRESSVKWREYKLPVKKDQQELLTHLGELLSYYNKKEPRTIRFDFFRLDILQVFAKEKINIELTLLQWLLAHKSTEERQQIKYIAFALFDSFIVNYSLLFNADYFPHLKKKAYLPEIATLIKMNDEKAICFFEQHHKDLYTAACQFNEDPASFNSDKVLQQFIANKTSGHNEIADLIGFNLLCQQTQLDLPLILTSIQEEMSFHRNLLSAKKNNSPASEDNFLYLDSDASYHVLTLLDEHIASNLLEQRLLLDFSHAESYKKLFTLLEQEELSTNQRNYLTFCLQQELAKKSDRKKQVLLKALSLEHYQFCKAFGLTSLQLDRDDFSKIPWLNIVKADEYDREILTWIITEIRNFNFGNVLLDEVGYALRGNQQILFAIFDLANRYGEIAEVLRFHLSTYSDIIQLLNRITYIKEGEFIDVFSKLISYGFNLSKKDLWGDGAIYCAVKYQNYNLLDALIKLGVDPTEEREGGKACLALAAKDLTALTIFQKYGLNSQRSDKKPSFSYARFHAPDPTKTLFIETLNDYIARCQNQEKNQNVL
jgi:hypothetical protein